MEIFLLEGHYCHFSYFVKFSGMTATRQPVASSVLALAPVADLADVSTTVLKNKFSDVARLASREPLAITRHNRREFVILTAEQ